MSWNWSCWQIQSLSLWYHTAHCRTMSLSITWILGRGNLHLVMRLQMHWDSACIPSLGCCLTLEISSYCSSDFIVVPVASRWHWVFSCCPLLWCHCLLRSGEPIFALQHELELLPTLMVSSACSVSVSKASR